MKITRVILSSDANPTYYHFWNPLSKVYAEKFKIRPTLVWIGTRAKAKDCGISDEYGDVIYQEPHPRFFIPWQCTWGFHWATKMFPDDVCMLVGIDQVPLSNRVMETIKDLDDDTYCVMMSDGYLPNHWAKENGASPSGYMIAKGSTFMKVNNFEFDFHKEIEKIANSGVTSWYEKTDGRWGIDESYSCHNLRKFVANGGKVYDGNLFKDFIQPNRIECYRDQETGYNVSALRGGLLSEAHLCRPYINHVDYINRIYENIPNYGA